MEHTIVTDTKGVVWDIKPHESGAGLSITAHRTAEDDVRVGTTPTNGGHAVDLSALIFPID